MGGVIRVRVADATSWETVRSVRLSALAESPGAFGSTVAREPLDTEDDWRRGAADLGAGSVDLWVADGNPRACRFYERLGFRHTGEREPMPNDPSREKQKMRRLLP